MTAVIPSYTHQMKTAISVPDATYERVTRRARELGMSRSELFARAAEEYLDHLDGRALPGRIDAALEHVGRDEATSAAVSAGRARLRSSDW